MDLPVVSRLLLPDDANPAGNVHGGTILHLMEQAGVITATRYVAKNRPSSDQIKPCIAVLVRFETMSFLHPLLVGQVASISANVVFTSEHSMLVKVTVTSEDMVTSQTRITNCGELWYVPLEPTDGTWKANHHESAVHVVPVPPMDVPSEGVALNEFLAGKNKYLTRKESITSQAAARDYCLDITGCLCPICRKSIRLDNDVSTKVHRSPPASEQRLNRVVLPSDCNTSGIAFAGFVMKEMDNCAGASAFRHARTNVVTVAISELEFLQWIRLGSICNIRSRVIFSSQKAMEVEVIATVTTMHNIDEDDDESKNVVAKGIFTFVSLNDQHKPIPVPPLKLETAEDIESAFQGQQRYEAQKKARLSSVQGK